METDMTDRLRRLLQPASMVLLPVLVYQGRRVRRGMRPLPEAAPLSGEVPGTGEAVRLLVLGDSMAAGVGVTDHADSLAGRVAAGVSEQTGRPVSWRVVARTGATAGYTTERLLGRAVEHGGPAPDAVVVLVGINDLLGFRSLRQWRGDIHALVTEIRHRLGAGVRVVFSGMPPLRYFPALPQPLRAVLGIRAQLMDEVLHTTASVLGAAHVPIAISRKTVGWQRLFARDQFHPSAEGYRLVAAGFIPVVLAGLTEMAGDG
jgi:lysophospholipase L1-like esterase